MGLDYEKLPEYIRLAEEIIRGLGKVATQEATIEEPEAQEAAKKYYQLILFSSIQQ